MTVKVTLIYTELEKKKKINTIDDGIVLNGERSFIQHEKFDTKEGCQLNYAMGVKNKEVYWYHVQVYHSRS